MEGSDTSSLHVREIHRRIHTKPRPPRYEPISVSEALLKIHTYLGSSIELGTYSYLASDVEAAKNVVELETLVDEVAYQLLTHMSVVVSHDLDSAHLAAPIYTYVLGVDKIMDALKDLASLVLRGFSPSPRLYRMLMHVSDVATTRIPGSKVASKSVEELCEEYAVEILAVLRGGKWILSPEEGFRISEGDTVYVKGFKDNVIDMLRSLGERVEETIEPSKSVEPVLRHVDSMMDIVLMLNDLAHYQLKAQDPMLAEEILELEEFLDEMRMSVSSSVLSLGELEERDRLALLTYITRLEDISDALTYIIAMPVQEEYRELLSSIVESGGERIRAFVSRRSIELPLLAKTLEDLGASILAIRRGREWIAVTPYNMSRLRIEPGDTVLVTYYEALEEDLARVMSSMGLEQRPA